MHGLGSQIEAIVEHNHSFILADQKRKLETLLE